MLPQKVRSSIVKEALAVLDHPDFAEAFGPDSRAEVPLVAEIRHPDGKKQPIRLNAVIDRLVVKPDGILVIDFKTNRPPPLDVADIPQAYLIQLAAYRLALRQIHPDRTARTAILWTDGARLMEVPGDLLDVQERELWQLASARLDG